MELYLTCDVLILADVFQAFRDMLIKYYDFTFTLTFKWFLIKFQKKRSKTDLNKYYPNLFQF
jgi:hypothetical protein